MKSVKSTEIDYLYKIFKPQLSPKKMLELGVFGGSYFEGKIKEYPKSWFIKAKLTKSFDSKQNYFAVKRFIEKILPHVKKEIPEVKVRIVGRKPPSSIKNMHNGYDFFVEGFVSDVRVPISKCCVMILPLELGAGFRSRIVEVMALGVPIVGTHNALDNAGLTSGKNAYISDHNEKMAEYLVLDWK